MFSARSSLTGAATTTLRTPAAKYGARASIVRNFPVLSITTSIPSSAHGGSPGPGVLPNETRRPSMTRSVAVGRHLTIPAAVHRVEREEVRRDLDVAVELVDVRELELRRAPSRAQREPSHATEAVDPDADHDRLPPSPAPRRREADARERGSRCARDPLERSIEGRRRAVPRPDRAPTSAGAGRLRRSAGAPRARRRRRSRRDRGTRSARRATAGGRSSRSRPARAAASTASGRTRSAGRVPALVAGTSWRAFQAAAASCDRAELALQTKRTCRAASVSTGSAITDRAPGRSRTYRRRASPSDAWRSMIPASSSTARWWASRLDPIPSDRPSSVGDRSERASSSTISSRWGSASAAWIAARRAIDISTDIDSIMPESPERRQGAATRSGDARPGRVDRDRASSPDQSAAACRAAVLRATGLLVHD